MTQAAMIDIGIPAFGVAFILFWAAVGRIVQWRMNRRALKGKAVEASPPIR